MDDDPIGELGREMSHGCGLILLVIFFIVACLFVGAVLYAENLY